MRICSDGCCWPKHRSEPLMKRSEAPLTAPMSKLAALHQASGVEWRSGVLGKSVRELKGIQHTWIKIDCLIKSPWGNCAARPSIVLMDLTRRAFQLHSRSGSPHPSVRQIPADTFVYLKVIYINHIVSISSLWSNVLTWKFDFLLIIKLSQNHSFLMRFLLSFYGPTIDNKIIKNYYKRGSKVN